MKHSASKLPSIHSAREQSVYASQKQGLPSIKYMDSVRSLVEYLPEFNIGSYNMVSGVKEMEVDRSMSSFSAFSAGVSKPML